MAQHVLYSARVKPSAVDAKEVQNTEKEKDGTRINCLCKFVVGFHGDTSRTLRPSRIHVCTLVAGPSVSPSSLLPGRSYNRLRNDSFFGFYLNRANRYSPSYFSIDKYLLKKKKKTIE